jgi:hypothetical protein
VPRRKPIDHDYTPINCERCGEPYEIRVNLTIRAPLGWKNLSKDGIRSRHVSIESADWDLAQFFCACVTAPGFSPLKTDAEKAETKRIAEERERRLKLEARSPLKGRRPGQRWTKGLVPKKAHPLTKKNHRMCKRKKQRPNEQAG